ncbi:MAG TPA: hypothetical protein V6D17_14870 [Candidatus Obscuribacterales bacterium]
MLAKSSQWALALISVLALFIGSYCVFRVCQLILDVGGNNLSNDYVSFVRLVDLVLSGTYDWRNYLADSFVGQHFLAVPILFHILVARLFEWNARAELLVGVGINMVRAVLITAMIVASLKRRYWALTLGVVLTLVFSLSQASIHLFGQACFPVALTVLGFVIGLSGLALIEKRPLAIVTMLAGGCIAGASMGNVAPCWAALLIALIVLGYRHPLHYLSWLIGAAISVAPYALFLASRLQLNPGQKSVNPIFFLDVLGRPFANSIGFSCGRLYQAELAGALGLAGLLLGVVGCCLLRRWHLSAKASLVLCAYGLLTCLMLSIVRSLVAPWYTAFAICYWLGVLGLIFAFLFAANTDEIAPAERVARPSVSPVPLAPGGLRLPDLPGTALVLKVLSLLFLVALSYFYMRSNRTWIDKHTFMFSRAPVSESALRHFRTGPTYMEGYLFQWGDGHPANMHVLARPLERQHLSAFSSHQVWPLQGDFILDDVRLFEHPGANDIEWLQGTDPARTMPWSHYEHGNLLLPSPNAIEWSFQIPAHAVSAQFDTAVMLPPAKNLPAHDNIYLKISLKERGETQAPPLQAPSPHKQEANRSAVSDRRENSRTAFPVFMKKVTQRGSWFPVSIPLSHLRGRQITLRMAAVSEDSLASPASTTAAGAAQDDSKIGGLMKRSVSNAKTGVTSPSSARSGAEAPSSDGAIILRYPIIDVRLDMRHAPPAPENADLIPANTEISKKFPLASADLFRFPSIANASWQKKSFKVVMPVGENAEERGYAREYPAVAYTPATKIALRDYTHVRLRMSAPADDRLRALKANIAVDGGSTYFSIPLLPDAKEHQYTFDLKLLELKQNDSLKELLLYPVATDELSKKAGIFVRDIELIKSAP